ncbi:MAG: hypothetical protein ABFR89_02420 [Actinomycetota bacterium]
MDRPNESQRHRDEALKRFKEYMEEAIKALSLAVDWADASPDVDDTQRELVAEAHDDARALMRRFDNPEVQRPQRTMGEPFAVVDHGVPSHKVLYVGSHDD